MKSAKQIKTKLLRLERRSALLKSKFKALSLDDKLSQKGKNLQILHTKITSQMEVLYWILIDKKKKK